MNNMNNWPFSLPYNAVDEVIAFLSSEIGYNDCPAPNGTWCRTCPFSDRHGYSTKSERLLKLELGLKKLGSVGWGSPEFQRNLRIQQELEE